MKTFVTVLLAAACLFTSPQDGNAQTPYLQVSFNRAGTVYAANCPTAPVGTVIDTMFVIAYGFGGWLNGIEYRVEYPPSMLWLYDQFDETALWIGTSYQGVGVAYTVPLNAFTPALIQSAVFLWMCQGCPYDVQNQLVCFKGYPSSGMVRAVRWPDLAWIPATSGTAAICATCGQWGACESLPVPTEQTTWGKIKAQYR